jgi:argininosuccinate synthase
LKQRIVFACSGSAENAAAIPWLAATCDAEIVAMTLDVGQGRELEGVRQAALAAGAIRAHVLDVREEFARDCILGSIQGGREEYPLGHALARPLIARKLIEIARIEGATAIAHGGDAGDHEAVAAAARAIDPSMRVIAAVGSTSAADGYTVHTTLWGRSFERGPRHAGDELPEEIYSLTAPSKGVAPDGPAHVEISFEAGLPVAVNGVPMTLTELIESVTTIAGNHGVGRVTHEASGTAGEAPAAVVLHAAHAALGVAAMRAADATVRVELFKGRHRVVSAYHS